MDIKEYINTGVLEAYLSGELNDEEMLAVDHLAMENPLIQKELDEIRVAINTYSTVAGKKTIPNVLDDVLNHIGEDQHFKPDVENSREANAQLKEVPTSRVPFWAVAASVLLLVSLGFNIFFYGKLEETRKEIVALIQERSLLTNQVETTGQQLDYAELRIAHFLNEDNIHVRMEGSPISPESFANVFWNKNTNTVFISVDNLPAPPDGHQYQLWAIKQGEAPIDAGIFDHSQLVQELKVIKGDVLAFAVTLEKEGGTQFATVDRTFVKGFLENS